MIQSLDLYSFCLGILVGAVLIILIVMAGTDEEE